MSPAVHPERPSWRASERSTLGVAMHFHALTMSSQYLNNRMAQKRTAV